MEEINKRLTQHFIDDSESFKELSDGIKDIQIKQARMEEKATENAQHFSYISRDMTLLKNLLENQVEDLKKAMTKAEEKNQPMVDWFGNINFLKNVLMWVLGAIVLAASAVAALPVIRTFIIKISHL